MNCECHLLKRLFNEYLAKNLDKKSQLLWFYRHMKQMKWFAKVELSFLCTWQYLVKTKVYKIDYHFRKHVTSLWDR